MMSPRRPCAPRVLLLDAAEEGDDVGLVGVPARDLLDQAAALRLRVVKAATTRCHWFAPGRGAGRPSGLAAEADQVVAEPGGVAVLDLGEAAERGRGLRVAGAVGVDADCAACAASAR
jgi:hypothetical protein